MVLRSHGCTTIHLILLYFSVNAFTSFANDTISGYQTLSGDQTIVSAGDNFVLGFFKPGKAPRHYIGIWFNKVHNQTVVWVANREIPVSDPNTAKLLISGGNLVLLNELGSEIWSTAVNSTSAVNSSLAAVLRDDGNLVLSDGTGSNPRSGQILWQSFGFRVRGPSDWDLKDYSGGCVREMSLQCNGSNGRGDKFWPVTNVGLPVNEDLLTVGSVGECESSCFNDCSCTAYAYDEGRGCSVWNGDLVNLQQLNEGDGNGKVIHIRLSASSLVFSGSKNSKGSMIGVVAGCVGGALVVVAVVVGLIWRRRKRAVGSSKAVEGSLAVFTYKDLQNATKNFSEKLGGGGFGSVFKGTLPDSTVIAAKKLESITQGEKQFRTEVSTIGTIQHMNLVRLRGFSSEGSKKLLVCDYMENGSLDSHLFHANEIKFLDWKTRYQIALGIARGLSYLHEKCRDCIIHCDIKPENILLDPEFCPKVADFGLAKLVGRDFSRVLTTMRGTRGYLAPEWISGVAITAKADVYSYGMMLFELVSGRRNSESSEDGTVKFFPSWAANAAVNGGDVLGLLDPVLDRNADAEEVLKICKIACWCIQDDEDTRPSMGQVVHILEGVMDVNPPPIPRSLQVFVETQEHTVFFTDSSTDQSSQAKSNASSNA
ncbi:hypothetical protein SASPL_121756 [Salvia splendens]|uniref:non-specific serine/threonine protein kinase n=1 Tax=Salvia splendens TaxID=180675 RepID=A0A8X8ZXL0_SALSN|nr:hypothetical protein SASPL_121756 [Salvia splendens]